MTKDEAIKLVNEGIVPLESFTVEGLKPFALALGMTVSSRPIKADLITSIKKKVAAELATTPAVTPVTPPAAPVVVTPTAPTTPTTTPTQKFPTEAMADRILNWMFKRS